MVVRYLEPATSNPVPPSGAGEATSGDYACREPKVRRGAVRLRGVLGLGRRLRAASAQDLGLQGRVEP